MFDVKKPYTVEPHIGKIRFVVMDAEKDALPEQFAFMALDYKKVAMRIAGGCSGMSDEDKQDMLEYMVNELQNYEGVFSTGSTRDVTYDKENPGNDRINIMVTDVPGVLASFNPGKILVLGTAPRTGTMMLQKDLQLALDEKGLLPNPSMHGILLVQNGPEGEIGWDGDLDVYFRMMRVWENKGFQVGLISWNGGGVTWKEIIHSVELGWPTFLIKGSGRKTDEFIKLREDGDSNYQQNNVIVVDKNVRGQLREALTLNGFLEE